MHPIAIATAAVILATGLLPAVAAAHAPSVDTAERSGPESALVLEDPESFMKKKAASTIVDQALNGLKKRVEKG